jgi:hypothetical protein
MEKEDEKNDLDSPEVRNPKRWGIFYIVLGIAGLCFSISIVLKSSDIVPLVGAVTSGALLGVLSLFMIILGYRVLKKDYE